MLLTVKDRILSSLAQATGPLCDDCLAKSVNVRYRQEVYQNCTRLAATDQIYRGDNSCVMCAKIKKASWADKDHQVGMNIAAAADTSLDASKDKSREEEIFA